MTDRIIEISEAPARLRVDQGRLAIEPLDSEPVYIPLDEIAVVVLAHPNISLTQPVLAGLAKAGGLLVATDQRRMPTCMMLPLEQHSTQTARIAAQVSVSRPTQKRLWQEIVREKVRAQARVLAELRGSDCGLHLLASRVRSGDPENIEAQASVRYWKALFRDPSFRRRRDGSDQNRLLNYGYAVVRAVIARAICGAGLHPGLGLHHRNQYNPFCLADDLMEPFRPVVDRAVANIVDERSSDVALDKPLRESLIATITGRFDVDGENRTLFDLASRAASTLAGVYLGRRRALDLGVP